MDGRTGPWTKHGEDGVGDDMAEGGQDSQTREDGGVVRRDEVHM